MAVKLPIYLDHHATTPVDSRVLEAMLPYFTEKFGNAASRNHEFGWRAEEAVENARAQVARLINAAPKEIVFTSGATESNNLAIKGVAEMHGEKGNHAITQVTEHKAVLDTCRRLERSGFEVTYLGVDHQGLIRMDELTGAIRRGTILISIMYANNEIGVDPAYRGNRQDREGEENPVSRGRCASPLSRIPVDVQKDGVDLLSISAHKLYGPKGSGALYVRRKDPRVQIAALIDGGGHERGMRSGTLNVPAIVGVGQACEIAQKEMAAESEKHKALRDRLKDALARQLDGTTINGSMVHRLPNNLNIGFSGVEGEALLMGISDVAVSSGSACTSANIEPSYVLRALGVSTDLAHSSIRFGIGRFNTQEEIDYAANRVADTVKRLRELMPVSK